MLEKEDLEEHDEIMDQQTRHDRLISTAAASQIDNATMKHKHLYKIYCIFKIFSHLINKFTNEQFNDYLKVLRILIMKVIVVSREIKLDDINNNNDEEMMQTDDPNRPSYSRNDSDLNQVDQYLDELFKMFESKQFSSKIESFLLQFNKAGGTKQQSNSSLTSFADENNTMLSQFCLSISYICDFVLINSDLKPHKSL
jgi:hypothetical protein